MNKLNIDWGLIGAFAFLAILFPVVIIGGQKQRRVAKQITKELAEKWGGELGEWDTLTIPCGEWQIFLVYHAGSKHSSSHTDGYVLLDRDLNLKFLLGRETLISKLGQAVGALQDIQVQDFEFNKTFRIKTDNENFTRDLLTNEIQYKLLQYKEKYPTIQIYKQDNAILNFFVDQLVSPKGRNDLGIEVSRQHTTIRISVPSNLTIRKDEYDLFIEISLVIFSRIQQII